MEKLLKYINEKYSLTGIPTIISGKRWASDGNYSTPENIEGVPQQIKLSERRGIIIYSYRKVSDNIIEDIKRFYKNEQLS